jgi:hypothetical protein
VLDRAVDTPDPDLAIRLGFGMWRFWQKHGHLAEARRRLEGMATEDWSRQQPTLRARLMEALGGVCWWQGDLAEMRVRYQEALDLWLAIGDDAEIPNAYYNASFGFALPPSPGEPVEDGDPEGIGLGYIEKAREGFHRIGKLAGEANALWALGNYHIFRSHPGNGVGQFREALAMFRQTKDVTMAAWARHMLASGLMRDGPAAVPEARRHVAHAARQFHAAGDTAGLTLIFDDFSAIAVLEGDMIRAARLRGVARNLATETGAGLAGIVENSFDQGVRPGVRTHMSPSDVERHGAEGAAMTLDDAVAYALEGCEAETDDVATTPDHAHA